MVIDLDEPEEEKRPEAIVNAYRDRLKSLKQARDYYAKGDIPKAVERYSTYLNTLASFFKIQEDQLNPSYFDPEKEISELLLISHAYWDLAKAYDRSPNLHNESLRCLDQFIKFSTGFKYQHINAMMLKKFIKRKQAHNLKAFQNAYQRLQVDSKGCFVASYSLGQSHWATNELRDFKSKTLAKNKVGFLFIEKYYQYSPRLIEVLENLGFLGKAINSFIIKPFLILLSRIHKTIK